MSTHNISFEVNNGCTLNLTQRMHNGSVLIWNSDHDIPDEEAYVSPGDFVMLLNYYRYIKRNDIRHDFINPNGKNKEATPC